MRVSKDDVDMKMAIPGATLRQRLNFGEAGEFGSLSAEFFTLARGVDTTPLFEDLDGGVCDSPHWGYMIRGQVTVTDAGGGRETVKGNDLFYWPPGHNVLVDADAEIVMFSPQREHSRVLDHMMRKVSEAQSRAS